MTGCSNLMHFCQKSIMITVQTKFLDILIMSGSISFAPQFLTASAKIRHASRRTSRRKRLLIHIGKHQNFSGFVILGDTRD